MPREPPKATQVRHPVNASKFLCLNVSLVRVFTTFSVRSRPPIILFLHAESLKLLCLCLYDFDSGEI